MKKVALITGSCGQDGSYLCDFLLKKNYKVIAADRRSSRNNNYRHKYLGIENKLIYEEFDICEIETINTILKKYKISEIYNLAAQSFVKTSFSVPISTSISTGLGVLNILESIKSQNKKIKFYQASSSEMYGNFSGKKSISEIDKFNPQSPYAIAKTFAHYFTQLYRKAYNIYACNGILFNHESPLRGEEFVTKKIIKQLSEIKNGKRACLEIGNIYAKRDWGYAKDYVEAMWLMLQQKKPDDYIIATGTTCSVKDFINESCKALNLKIKWTGRGLKIKAINIKSKKVIIRIDSKYFRPSEVHYLKGNCSKARKKLKWRPKTSLKELIKIMINFEKI
jgi:GDPmannose 4,6-dehydratase